jgi:hypothetical protein
MAASKFEVFWARALQEPKRAQDHANRAGIEGTDLFVHLLQHEPAPLSVDRLNLIQSLNPLMRVHHVMTTNIRIWTYDIPFYHNKFRVFLDDLSRFLTQRELRAAANGLDLINLVKSEVEQAKSKIQEIRYWCERDLRESVSHENQLDPTVHLALGAAAGAFVFFNRTMLKVLVSKTDAKSTLQLAVGHSYIETTGLVGGALLGYLACDYAWKNKNRTNALMVVGNLLAELDDILNQNPLQVKEEEQKDS